MFFVFFHWPMQSEVWAVTKAFQAIVTPQTISRIRQTCQILHVKASGLADSFWSFGYFSHFPTLKSSLCTMIISSWDDFERLLSNCVWKVDDDNLLKLLFFQFEMESVCLRIKLWGGLVRRASDQSAHESLGIICPYCAEEKQKLSSLLFFSFFGPSEQFQKWLNLFEKEKNLTMCACVTQSICLQFLSMFFFSLSHLFVHVLSRDFCPLSPYRQYLIQIKLMKTFMIFQRWDFLLFMIEWGEAVNGWDV